ncbi:hypothetical protein EJB05_30710, partial [Eragrostis curvula]
MQRPAAWFALSSSSRLVAGFCSFCLCRRWISSAAGVFVELGFATDLLPSLGLFDWRNKINAGLEIVVAIGHLNMTMFAPMQRKSSRPGKSIIMKKSRKELATTRAHMQRVSILKGNVGCNVMDQTSNLSSQPTKQFPSEDSNVKWSWTTMIRDSSPLEKDIGASRPNHFKAMKENNSNGAIEDSNKKLNCTNGKEFSFRMFGKDLSNNPRDNTSSMDVDKRGSFDWIDQRELKETNYKLDYCDGKTKNGKRRIGSLQDGKPKPNLVKHNEEVVEDGNQTLREMKKPRRRKVIFEEVEDEAIEDDTSRQMSIPAIVKYNAKVSMPFFVEQQSNCCSKPIAEPTWRGIFKIGQKYVSLSGHLSTKYGEKVWKLSRSLMPIVEVTKISRSKAWPKRWEASKPNGDNIGLYFFPNEMRTNDELDQLVKEVMENDLVLQAIIGEVEMLIFPSILLPKQYMTFQGKNYLWGVFKPRKHEGIAAAEPLNVNGCCAHGVKKEAQHFSTHQCEVQRKEQDQGTNVAKSATSFMNQDFLCIKNTHEVLATKGTPNKGFEPKAPEEGIQGDVLHHGMRTSEAMESAIDGGTLPANHGEIDRSRGLLSGSIFGFVAGHTSRLLQLIRELEREGGVVIAMHGETIGPGPWQRNITSSFYVREEQGRGVQNIANKLY